MYFGGVRERVAGEMEVSPVAVSGLWVKFTSVSVGVCIVISVSEAWDTGVSIGKSVSEAMGTGVSTGEFISDS